MHEASLATTTGANPLPSSAAVSAATDDRRLAGWQRPDSIALAVLVGLGAALPLALSAGLGSLSIPHADDWAFRRVASQLFRTHHVVFVGWGVMTLVGQVISVQPLLELTHGARWTFGAYGALTAAIALASTYCLARRFVPTGTALLAAGCVAIAPGFITTGTTFMTDVPALAATMTCLAVGVSALDRVGRSRSAGLSAAMAIGVFGFAIRQFCIAAPIAVLVAAIAQTPRDWRRLLAFAAVIAAACGGVSLWAVSLPGIHEANLLPDSLHTGVASTVRLGADLGLAVLPAALWAVCRRGEGLARLVASGLAAVTVAAAVKGGGLANVFPPSVTRQGMGGNAVLAGVRPNLYSGVGWSAIEAAALAGVIVVVAIGAARAIATRPSDATGRALAWFGRPEGLLAGFLLLAGGGLVVLTLAGVQAFDRYTWPLVGPLAILLLARTPSPVSRHRVTATAIGICSLTGLLALASVVLAANADAFDAARWRAGTALTRQGLPAAEVDAGFEWFGYRQPGPVIHPLASARAGTFAWYESIFVAHPICAVVSASPLPDPGLVRVGTTTYRLLGAIGTRERLYRYVDPAVAGCGG